MSTFDPAAYFKLSPQEKHEAARTMPPEDKLLAGQRLFEHECQLMLVEIREQFPEADEAQRQEILRERIDLAVQSGEKF